MALFERQRAADPFAEINAQIAAADNEAAAGLASLGKAYFDLHRDDAEEALAPAVASIKKAEERGAIYRELLLRARGVKICPNCKSEVTSASAFCNYCGAKIPEPAPLTDGEKVFCNVCAAPMPIGQKFCSQCGSVLPELSVNEAALSFEEPVIEEPVVEEPVVDEPVVEEPVAEEPVVEEPVVEEPVAEEPIVEEPVIEEPVAEEPVIEEPAVVEPAEAPVETPAEPETKTCPRCGHVLSVAVKFCTACGLNLSAPPAPSCPKCGKTVAPGARFCTGCGTQLN